MVIDWFGWYWCGKWVVCVQRADYVWYMSGLDGVGLVMFARWVIWVALG